MRLETTLKRRDRVQRTESSNHLEVFAPQLDLSLLLRRHLAPSGARGAALTGSLRADCEGFGTMLQREEK